MELDLHIHSKYSYDSFMSPENIIKIAKKRKLNGIAITDHNTIKGGLEAKKFNKNSDFIIITGTEIHTEYGDIIGLFINEEIKKKNFLDVVEEIKSQSGISILAHPYRGFSSPEKIIDKVDFVEGFNARSNNEKNTMAIKLAAEYNKSVTAGSDAHSFFEIGNGITIFDSINCLYNGNLTIKGRKSNYYLSHAASVIAEKIKKMIV